MFIYFNRLYLN